MMCWRRSACDSVYIVQTVSKVCKVPLTWLSCILPHPRRTAGTPPARVLTVGAVGVNLALDRVHSVNDLKDNIAKDGGDEALGVAPSLHVIEVRMVHHACRECKYDSLRTFEEIVLLPNDLAVKRLPFIPAR